MSLKAYIYDNHEEHWRQGKTRLFYSASIDSLQSLSYRNNINNKNDYNNNIFIFAQTGTYGLSYKNFRPEGIDFRVRFETRLKN